MEMTDAQDAGELQNTARDNGRGAVKPFVKWAGGKGQLLSEIRRRFPPGLGTSVTKYAEPFVGGGAVLFDILGAYELEAIYISDVNAELINAYRTVRDDVDGLVRLLEGYQGEYALRDPLCRKQYYYDKRRRFNELKAGGGSAAGPESAALFLFLNRTCFNGLYRVNRRGLFNVPMGAYKNPTICDRGGLVKISRALQRVDILCGDYRQSAGFIDGRTFVYIDPPYRPLTDTADFTAYTQTLFDDDAQRELAGFVSRMGARGAKVLLSNSDPKNADAQDNFFDALYAGRRVERVEASRMINRDGAARGKITELLIRTYETGSE